MQELRDFSQLLGENMMLIQGAGGNTSCKIDSIMWVKASGKLLAHAAESDIFVPINYQKLSNEIESQSFDIADYIIGPRAYPISTFMKWCSRFLCLPRFLSKNRFTLFGKRSSSNRPSIEAPFHAVFSSNAVIHAHAINTLTAMVLPNCNQYVEEKIGDVFDYLIVDYAAPGIGLARTIKKHLTEASLKMASEPIIFMKNHGVIVAGHSMSEAYDKLLAVEKLLEFAPRIVDNEVASNIPTNDDYELLSNWRGLATDENCLNVIAAGPLFPDQAVYLGNSVPIVNQLDETTIAPLVVVRNLGLFRRKDCDASTAAIIEALLMVCIRLPLGLTVKTIPPIEVDFLINWEAEKYRKSQTSGT
jgi:rhamnose utilization protein RhaD (predicted bifunctional aldolase and dehydrogenase)